MNNKNKRILYLVCCGWIIFYGLVVCLRIFSLLNGKVVGFEFGIHLLELLFLAMFGSGLWAVVRSKPWGELVAIVGILGQLVLGIAGEYSQIMAGNLLAILKVTLALILVWVFVSLLHEGIKDKRIST